MTLPSPLEHYLKPHLETRPSAAPTTVTLDRVTFGKRLRLARQQFGWTLQKVSDLSGVSIPTISRAERGQLALGYDNISALAQALNIDMGTLFAEDGKQQGPLAEPVLTRASEGVSYKGLNVSYEFLGATALGKTMRPVLATIHARSIDGPDDFARHDGEEFVYALRGEVDVHFENGRCIQLARGDSLYFDSRIGHTYVSTGRHLARLIVVMTENYPAIER
ncbi:helix-turn-helix domain-containing protein [Variovorax sp. DAIF25]|uniref:helix-turn-helix domain-containing protein n=1 Tax=Variovorax sp. DAIF25 TaxID=3080983 RepID=UPI003D6C5731